MTDYISSLAAPVPLAPFLAGIRNGEVSIHDAINDTCDRIQEVDLLVRAVLPETGRRERLLQEAETLENRYPDIEARPPLFGALLGVKDIIAVDGFLTRGGSALPPEVLAMPEAIAVRRMREAGALILGKTVTTEFAAREPGATTNPHNRAHTPGGSSSGSAAGISAGLFHLGFGTQTIGSVIRPASFCGIVGFKPTNGRISRSGVLTYSNSVDHVGLFAADAAGMRIAATAACVDWNTNIDLSKHGMPKIGVTEGPYLDQADEESRATLETVIEVLKNAGATVVRLSMFDNIATINARHEALVAAEFAEAHRDRFEQWGTLYRPFSAQHFEEGTAISETDIDEGRNSCFELRADLDALFEIHDLDLLLSPAATGAAPCGLSWTGDASMNLPWTHSGLPTVTLPASTAPNGLPIGVQFAAPFGCDEQLLGWTTYLEDIVISP